MGTTIASILESRISQHFCKMLDSKYFGLVGPMVSIATVLLYSEAARDNTHMNRCGCVLIKIYLYKQTKGWIWPLGHTLLILP